MGEMQVVERRGWAAHPESVRAAYGQRQGRADRNQSSSEDLCVCLGVWEGARHTKWMGGMGPDGQSKEEVKLPESHQKF